MWIEKFSPTSYRSIFKWGNPRTFHHPDDRLVSFIREVFGVTDKDLENLRLTGTDEVKLTKKPRLSDADVKKIVAVVGKQNVDISGYERARHAVGYTYLDAMHLRMGNIVHPPDLVVYPRSEADVVKLVDFCAKKKIPVTPFAGRSSVTFGVEPVKGGISLDLTRHMNKVLEIDETSFVVRVQPGIFGPAFEKILNDYRSDRISTGFTCGHFPQSFEYSCVGGWVMTRGAGGQSTGYGKIEHMVICMRVVTPKGVIVTKKFPADAIGPDIDQILMGSEGAYGVMTECTMKIWPYRPENRKMFSWFFKDWDEGLAAMREIMQGQFGFPSMLRLSDAEETDIAMKLQGLEGTAVDKFLSLLGYKPGKRVLLLGSTEGDGDHGKLIVRKVRSIARKRSGFPLGAIAVKGYWKRRYNDPYMREDLMDIGIISDTLETACSWDNIRRVWEDVRKVIKKRPRTVLMVHASHAYPNGANLYFIFLSPTKRGKEIEDYTLFQHAIIDAIVKAGGSLSHHHGIGKLFAPWYEAHVGPVAFGMLKAIKEYLDPGYILNPGGTLGLDAKKGKK